MSPLSIGVSRRELPIELAFHSMRAICPVAQWPRGVRETVLFMLAKIVIQCRSTNAEPTGNLSLRNTSAHPLACLGKLFISECFRAALINPAGLGLVEPLSIDTWRSIDSCGDAFSLKM